MASFVKSYQPEKQGENRRFESVCVICRNFIYYLLGEKITWSDHRSDPTINTGSPRNFNEYPSRMVAERQLGKKSNRKLKALNVICSE